MAILKVPPVPEIRFASMSDEWIDRQIEQIEGLIREREEEIDYVENEGSYLFETNSHSVIRGLREQIKEANQAISGFRRLARQSLPDLESNFR